MPIFSMIVSIASGIMVLINLCLLFIRPIREKFLKVEEEKKLLIQATEETKKEVSELCKEIAALADSREKDKAENARTMILRFADEIYEGAIKHSKEHFDDILDKITRYNAYCESHPGFKNERTVMAQERIKEIYKKCEKDHSFLGDIKIQ